MTENADRAHIAENSKTSELRRFWQSRTRKGGVQKHETGIKGFDEMLEGGLPRGRVTLISAGTGCGKTVLLNEFVYRGAAEFGEPGLFLTFEERPEDILLNLRNFLWDLDPLIEDRKIVLMDASPVEEGEVNLGSVNWFEPMLARIEHVARDIGAKRLAVDNLGSIFLRYSTNEDDERFLRDRLFRFSDRIKRLGVTTLISTENIDHTSSLSRHNVEEFVSEGLIELSNHTGEGAEIRKMVVRKLRGCTFRSGNVRFDITARGIEVFPKIPLDTSVGDTDFDVRKTFGVAELDAALHGGIPEGHVVLVAGNTGTGKTTLGLHFLRQGLETGETGVWVALEEPVKVILKTARAHGWDLQPHVDSGTLRLVTAPLIDVAPDRLLYRIIDAVNETGAKRIVVDSVSSMESAAMGKEQVREFMLQLAGFAKTRGITVILNYLSGDAFGAEKGQLLGSLTTNAMRLSSIVDGMILLRYVERDQNVRKLLNILKLRGSQHNRDILNFELTRSGFVVGQRFSGDM